MILVTVKLRANSPEVVQAICRLAQQVIERTLEPGFLRVRCAVHLHDPCQVLDYQEWGSRAAFDAWFTSAARVDLLRQLAPLMERDWQIDQYEEV